MAVQNLVIEKKSVDNYPYGGLKCTMSFYVEFNPKKGYRACTQSINPKNGRVNKPKCGTYYDFVYLTEKENGHIGFGHFSFNTTADVDGFVALLKTIDYTFSPEESEYFWVQVISRIRYKTAFTKLADGVTTKEYLEGLKFSQIVSAFKNKEDIKNLLTIGYNSEDVKVLEQGDKINVTVTEYA